MALNIPNGYQFNLNLGAPTSSKPPVSSSPGTVSSGPSKPVTSYSSGGSPAISTSPSYSSPSYSAPSYTPPSNFNSNAANNIVYWKQQYDAAVNAGKPKSSLDYIKNQAQASYGQLDPQTAKALQGMNANQAAAWYQGVKSSMNGGGNQVSAQGIAQPDQPVAVDPYANIMENPLYQQMMMQMAAYQDSQAAYQQQLAMMQQQQEEFARQQAEAQRAAFNGLIDQYGKAQDADLQALDNQYASAKGELEDQSFQQYLQARQAMANRGLAGSGLANDQDTRLLMANSKNLANLQRGVQEQKAGVKLRYGSQIDNLKNQIAALPYVSGVGKTPVTSPSGSGGDVSSLLAAAYKPDDTLLQYAEKMLETLMPYSDATVKEKMDAQRELIKVFGYDDAGNLTLDARDKAATQQLELAKALGYLPDGTPTLDAIKTYGYDQNGNLTLQARTNADTSQQNWAKIFGYGPDGTPTLEANKFAFDQQYKGALINQGQQKIDLDKWYKSNTLDQNQQKINLDSQRLQLDTFKTQNQVQQDWAKVQVQQQNANLAAQKFQFDQSKFGTQQQYKEFTTQLSAMKNYADMAYKQMNDAKYQLDQNAKNKGKEDPNLVAAYNDAKNKYQVAMAGYDRLAQLGVEEGVNNKNGNQKIVNQVVKDVSSYFITSDSLKATAKANVSKQAASIKVPSGIATSGIQQTDASKIAYNTATTKYGLKISSGKRSAAHNAEVNGSKTSAHLTGRAYDFAGSTSKMDAFAKWAASSGLYKQVIWNDVDLMSGRKIGGHKDHVHVSW